MICVGWTCAKCDKKQYATYALPNLEISKETDCVVEQLHIKCIECGKDAELELCVTDLQSLECEK